MPSRSPRANITVLSLVAVLLAGAAFSSAAIAADRDRDRMSDRWERKYELNPRSAKDAGRDPDRDGLRNRREARAKTNPRRKDTDRDGLRDRFELRRSHTNPRRRDTDRDGMKDGFEVRHGLDPRNPADAAQDPDRRADLTPGTPPSGPGGGLDTVRPASPVGPTGPLTIRLSTDSTGQQANSASGANSVSADGRYVVFTSRATNLVPGDTDPSGVFIKDAHTGTVTRVNKNAYGEPSNQPAFDPVMSADGRYVAFRSNADNLIAGDTPNSTDIFVKDVLTGTITRVSEAADGGVPIGYGPFSPSISVDGRYVSFQAGGDIFVRDTHAGTLTRVSTGSHQSALSADGRYVAFESAADNLVPGDTNGRRDVFVKDTHTGSTTRVSVSSTGTQATHSPSTLKAMTPDGRYVVLVAKDALVPGDTNGVADVFVSDTHTGTLTRVSTAAGGAEASGHPWDYHVSPDNYYAEEASISADGRYVAFTSHATNLVPGDTNAKMDVFVKDVHTGSTTRANVGVGGAQADGPGKHIGHSYGPLLSSDGRYLVFSSVAINLVPGDTNGTQDVFRVARP
jgi:Tol biopolymer transport system component